MLLSGERALARFREGLQGEPLLDLVERNQGKALISLPVGIGKSYAGDNVILTALERFDLTIGLFPTWAIINERHRILNPPNGERVVVLRPRPTAGCGRERNKRWMVFEKNGLGALGRAEICGNCPNGESCPWPSQYSSANLAGAKLIIATQKHLEVSPGFIEQLRRTVGATTVFSLMDESNFVMARQGRQITARQIEDYVRVLEACLPGWGGDDYHNELLFQCRILLSAQTDDMRRSDWTFWRPLPRAWEIDVQRAGVDLLGDDGFKDVGSDLALFGRSRHESRERGTDGAVRFAATPFVGSSVMILSGTSNREFVSHRLRTEIADPFADVRFAHPESRFFNLASRLGMQEYYWRNFPQTVDFVSELVAQQLAMGKRPLLVTKKAFLGKTKVEVQRRLSEFGFGDVAVVTGNDPRGAPNGPMTIPLISFGTLGVNTYEACDSVICASGFYAADEDVSALLQEVRASDLRIEVGIRTEGNPLRRKAGAVNPADRRFDVHHLADLARQELEDDTVVQAIGRVRPFTKPRMVLTFQCSALPGIVYDQEFHSLGEARAYFGLSTRRAREKRNRATAVATLRAAGHTQKQTAESMEMSVRMVRRYWGGTAEADTNPN